MIRKPPLIASYDDAQAVARKRLPRSVFNTIDGAAGNEASRHGNRQALRAKLLRHRVLAGVEATLQPKSILGMEMALPFGICPMAMCRIAHWDADRIMACWASDHDSVVGVSTSASTSLEEMWHLANGRAWFQLYHGGCEEQTDELVNRALNVGYRHLILTADVPVIGHRPREIRAGFSTPFKITPRHVADFAMRPRWALSMLKHGAPSFANFDSNAPFNRYASRVGANWQYLQRLRERWPHQLIIKGVVHPEDAVRLKEAGVDAIIVSNHGGRQLESAQPAINALPVIREAVGEKFSLFFDSGIESGEDIVKAYALGADFVFVGRSAFYSVSAGTEGLEAMSEVLASTCTCCLTQLGLETLDEAHPNIIVDD